MNYPLGLVFHIHKLAELSASLHNESTSFVYPNRHSNTYEFIAVNNDPKQFCATMMSISFCLLNLRMNNFTVSVFNRF